MNGNLIKSPLNYTGGKFRLLSQILPLFPKSIATFYDLFCGGCDVALNTCAEKIVCCDIDEKLVGLLRFLSRQDENFCEKIAEKIDVAGLSNSRKNGYAFYGCESAKGLGSFNREKFLKLRGDFNSLDENSDEYFLLLYILLIFCFNNQIRFNSQGKFNLPVGKRDFNANMQKKLRDFIKNSAKIDFACRSFDFFDARKMQKDDFVYCDPPYLITCATYNEKGWGERDERKLLDFLDEVNECGIKFALSNVLKSNGKENKILGEWLENRDYFCHHLTHSYSNANYHKKKISPKCDEVLIINYEAEK